MRYTYDQENIRCAKDAQAMGFLLCNGLGGYSAMTGAFSALRADQGVLVGTVTAPNVRINLVHRLRETLDLGNEQVYLSTQEFADGTPDEDGCRYATAFTMEHLPTWEYRVGDVRITRRCCMAYGENTAAVLYTVDNRAASACTLDITPFLKFAPKEAALTQPMALSLEGNRVSCDGYTLYIYTNGTLEATDPAWQCLSYREDAKDGRDDRGIAGACCRIRCTVEAGSQSRLEVVFSVNPCQASGWQLLQQQEDRLRRLEQSVPFTNPMARQLAVSADAYIVRRDSTRGKTIIAGYPLFSDWGRDTMIALPGCTLSTGRLEDAKSILRTFLAYEKDGLVPNLFPEGGQPPMYNTVDAALLLIDCVWHYLQRSADTDFVREAWPVMERIIAAYRRGTHHAIGMDTDALIFAGAGLDQVTWMDVCVQGILPTPRHGKPVEINAYWYNALMIMERLAQQLGTDPKDYALLAQQVRESFLEKFYVPEKGCLRDVISGTEADLQIRCNQIWALAMPFTMLPPQWEKQVLDTVTHHLLTPCGLRTLSPEDRQYHGFYGGSQLERDLAYHQGTTWVFPMGAYFRAYLRIHGNTPQAAAEAERMISCLEPMLREGCLGQLPEIYDGDHPYQGKGCFAQAWSVGEMLRVFEAIHNINHNEVTNEP